MKKIEKITVYVASDYGYDTLTRVIEILTDDIDVMGTFSVIDWENPVEYNLVEKGD